MVDWKWLTATRREAFEKENLNDAHLSSHRSKNSSVSFRWKCGQRHKIDAGVFVICVNGRHVNKCDVVFLSVVLFLEHSFEWRLTKYGPLVLQKKQQVFQHPCLREVLKLHLTTSLAQSVTLQFVHRPWKFHQSTAWIISPFTAENAHLQKTIHSVL